MYCYCENNCLLSSDPTGYWDKNNHKALNKDAGFNATTQSWSKKPDERYLSYNNNMGHFSSPFHSRGKDFSPHSLEIARYIYNKAVWINKEANEGKTKALVFKYGFEYGSNYLSPYYLGYVNKDKNRSDPNNKEVKSLNAQNLIYDLNHLKNRKEQSYALLGLALHVLQDHFAHLTRLYVYKCFSNKKSFIANMATTTFQQKYVGTNKGDNMKFEDNINVISWRYTNTKRVTKDIYNRFALRKYINRIEEKQIGSLQSYWYYSERTKLNLVYYTQEFYLYIT